ncbi:MAG: hypothetical protein ACLSB9_25415 [Hydrogeniiclostridium mannosilyticum]
MKINPSSEKPIFMQIAGQLEDSIFTGVFQEEQKSSTNEISVNINPTPYSRG